MSENYVLIPLSKTGKIAGMYTAIVSPEDADLADFNWTVDQLSYAMRKVTISNRSYSVKMHRVIMERMIDRPLKKHEHVDHIDNDGFCNLRENLRLVSHAQNMGNKKRSKSNTSGYKGVSYISRDNKWRAGITFRGQPMHIGYFDTPEEAHAAYCERAKELHGEYANFGSNPSPLDSVLTGDIVAKHTDFNKPFAQLSAYMKSTRIENGLSQRMLAERLEVHHTYISKIEGQTIEMLPSVDFIKRLADVSQDPHWLVLNLVGYVDGKALERRAQTTQWVAELLGYIADGELTEQDAIDITAEIRQRIRESATYPAHTEPAQSDSTDNQRTKRNSGKRGA